MASRSKPFSGKKKKLQMQEKRLKKQGLFKEDGNNNSQSKKNTPSNKKGNQRPGKPFNKKNTSSDVIDLDSGPSSSSSAAQGVQVEDLTRGRKMQFVPGACTADGFPLKTVFAKEDHTDVEARIQASHLPIGARLRREDGPSREGGDAFYSVIIDFPHRPPWDHSWTAQKLDTNERAYFDKYLRRLYERYPASRLNYFEHNIEVWRQLWRVLELSDVLLVLADIRHPIFHFPPSLYRYVTETLGKPMILVLNKIDLVPNEIAEEWVLYFQTTYPHLKVVPFSNYVREGGDLQLETTDVGTKIKRRPKRYGAARGVVQLLRACGLTEDAMPADIDQPAINFSDSDDDEEIPENHQQEEGGREDNEADDADEGAGGFSHPHAGKPKPAFTTIGLIGHPNVGKSSIINSLKKKKVVSTSRTPGHTKHFQTIFLTPKVRLCDSPGLIFPALDMPKELQVLSGLYPIAQTREPYSAIGFLAKRVPIERVYGLRPVEDPDADPETYSWSAWELCEAYAKKRCYTTKRGRFDVYRAGNEILRETLDGVILLYFAPPLTSMRSEAEEQERSPSSSSESIDSQNQNDQEQDQEQDQQQQQQGEEDIDF